MPDYKKLYYLLFNAITTAVERLDRKEPSLARFLLIEAQRQAEELYISSEDS